MLKAEKLKLETDYADDTDAECRKPARGRSSSVNSVASVVKTSESVSAFSVLAFQRVSFCLPPSASVDRPSCLCAFVVKTPGPWFRSPIPILLTADYTPACAGPSAGRDDTDTRENAES
jgi:hypothetical protein